MLIKPTSKMRVNVESYNPDWHQQFLQIKTRLEQALNPVKYISIEHVGSTSVPGLAAKPRIDVDIIVQQTQLASVTEALKSAGYQFLGDRGIPDRYAFIAPEPKPEQNLYVCVENSQALRNHLLVRDLCRQSEELRDIYGQKKLELAKREWSNVDEYCVAKNDVLAYILSRGMTEDETNQIRDLNTTSQGK